MSRIEKLTEEIQTVLARYPDCQFLVSVMVDRDTSKVMAGTGLCCAPGTAALLAVLCDQIAQHGEGKGWTEEQVNSFRLIGVGMAINAGIAMNGPPEVILDTRHLN